MQIQTSALVISYLDVIAKVGFGLIALSGVFTFSDTRTGTESPAD
jgi:bacteriorhodopsin